MEETKQSRHGAERETNEIAKLADYIAVGMAEYGTVTDKSGNLNTDSTATDVLVRLGDFADEVNSYEVSYSGIASLVTVVGKCAIDATTAEQKHEARTAIAALNRVIRLWGIIKDVSTDLTVFSYAVQDLTKEAVNTSEL